MVNLLLKHRSPLNATDNAGYTALHHAVAEGHGDTAVALLKAGAETDKKDMDGFLALDLAPDKDVCLLPSLAFTTILMTATGPEIHRTRGRKGGH
jgi:hypothetical protein